MHGHLSDRADRLVMALSGFAAAMGIVIAGCGVASRRPATPTRPGGSAGAHRVTPADNQRAARREAVALLGKAVLPAGAVRAGSEPADDQGALAHPAQVPGLADLVDLHGWWRLTGSVDSAYRFIKAHGPPGARLSGFGRRYPRPSAAFVDFEMAPVKGVLQSRDLNITIAPLPGHAVGVRVDSQVVWTFPRPASEYLPASVHAIRITRQRFVRLPAATATVTAPGSVRRLVKLFNRLPIEQPGTLLGCAMRVAEPTVIFSFRTAPDASPLAVVTYTGSCGGTDFRIHGAAQRPLDGVYNAVLASEQLTGLNLIPQLTP